MLNTINSVGVLSNIFKTVYILMSQFQKYWISFFIACTAYYNINKKLFLRQFWFLNSSVAEWSAADPQSGVALPEVRCRGFGRSRWGGRCSPPQPAPSASSGCVGPRWSPRSPGSCCRAPPARWGSWGCSSGTPPEMAAGCRTYGTNTEQEWRKSRWECIRKKFNISKCSQFQISITINVPFKS